MTHAKRGFTLIEALITTSIAVIILGVILSLSIISRQSLVMGSAFLDIHSDARMALDWMVKDVRWATQVLPSRTIDSQTYNTGTDELVFEIPAIDTNGDVLPGQFDYVVYHLNGTDLERIVDADTASLRNDENHIIANNVNSLVLRSGGIELSSIPDVTTLTHIAMALTTGKTSEDRIFQETLSSIGELRNKE